jgi:hypothetical protein
MNDGDLDKRFQLYADHVLKKKVGQDGFERQRFASAIACFLLLRDVKNGLIGDLPSSLSIQPRVDTSNRDGATIQRLKKIAYGHFFEDAKSAIAPKSYKAITMLFVDDARMRAVGAALGQSPDTDSNASINNERARAHVENGAELLARHFQARRNKGR